MAKEQHKILCKSLTEHREDRLSSLPDAILTVILSFLPTNTAASTSVLSHRWRHLWTGVARLDFFYHDVNFTDFCNNILLHLTTPKLQVFQFEFYSMCSIYDLDVLESCFHDICRRNVEEFILIDQGATDGIAFFPMPDCVLNCQSLINLQLFGPIGFDYKGIQFQLPNLKKLYLTYLFNVPGWLWSLYKFAPLLEDLSLEFEISSDLPPLYATSSQNIFFHNLKSLELALVPGIKQISIDAPKLTNLVINGCVLPHSFRRNPTALIKARFALGFEEEGEKGADDFTGSLNFPVECLC